MGEIERKKNITICKEDIVEEYFNIKSNAETKALEKCKRKCEFYLITNSYDYDIKNLINVINAEISYFKDSDKEKAREFVIDYWYELCTKENLTFYDIKILNIIMFVAPSIEGVIDVFEDLQIQLENYKNEVDYLITKISINSNLSYLLLEYKHINKEYSEDYDSVLIDALNKMISYNMDSKLNNTYFVALASLRKGIVLKDRNLVYISLLLLDEVVPDEEHDELIKSYIKMYRICI